MAKTRPFLIALLSVLLLFSQHMAVTHALWHQTHGIPATGALVGEASHTHEHDGELGQLCAFDAVLGQILAGGAVSQTPALSTATSAGFLATTLAPLPASESIQPRSRGPPVLL